MDEIQKNQRYIEKKVGLNEGMQSPVVRTCEKKKKGDA